jgi:hypothetical protein
MMKRIFQVDPGIETIIIIIIRSSSSHLLLLSVEASAAMMKRIKYYNNNLMPLSLPPVHPSPCPPGDDYIYNESLDGCLHTESVIPTSCPEGHIFYGFWCYCTQLRIELCHDCQSW